MQHTSHARHYSLETIQFCAVHGSQGSSMAGTWALTSTPGQTGMQKKASSPNPGYPKPKKEGNELQPKANLQYNRTKLFSQAKTKITHSLVESSCAFAYLSIE